MQARARSSTCRPMGAAAITTSGFPLDRARMARAARLSPRRCRIPMAASRRSTTSPRPTARSSWCFLHLGRLDPGPAVLDRASRSGSSMCPTPSCRSPRSCRRSAIRCRSSICAIWPRRRSARARADARRHAQHALHRHERQRGRDARGRATRPSPSAERVLDLLAALLPALAGRRRRVRATISAAPASPSPNSPTRWCGAKACPSAQAHEIAADVAPRRRRRGRRPAARRLRALRRRRFDRHAGREPELDEAATSPRSSRPSISSPCASASAGRRRRRWTRRSPAIAPRSTRSSARRAAHRRARSRGARDELDAALRRALLGAA